MESPLTNIKLDIGSWKIKVRERRNNRMRIQVNLSKDEALAYKNFADLVRPEDVADSDFMKTVFLTGIEAMNKELAELVKKYALENKEGLASSGITVLEDADGKVQLADTRVLEHDLSGEGKIKDNVLHDDAIRKYTEKD